MDKVWEVDINNANVVVQSTDEGFIMAGNKDSSIFIQKRDAIGGSSWSKTYNFSAFDEANDVIRSTDSNYVMVGSRLTVGNEKDILLVKFDENGDTLFSRTYGSQYNDVGNSVIVTADGGYAIIGYTTISILGYSQVWMIKIDANGFVLWEQKFGLLNQESKGVSIRNTSDGGYIIAAEKDKLYSYSWLIKTDANGVTAVDEVNKEGLKGKLLKIVDVLGRETKAVSNTPLFYIYEGGTVEKKIILN